MAAPEILIKGSSSGRSKWPCGDGRLLTAREPEPGTHAVGTRQKRTRTRSSAACGNGPRRLRAAHPESASTWGKQTRRRVFVEGNTTGRWKKEASDSCDNQYRVQAHGRKSGRGGAGAQRGLGARPPHRAAQLPPDAGRGHKAETTNPRTWDPRVICCGKTRLKCHCRAVGQRTNDQ